MKVYENCGAYLKLSSEGEDTITLFETSKQGYYDYIESIFEDDPMIRNMNGDKFYYSDNSVMITVFKIFGVIYAAEVSSKDNDNVSYYTISHEK